MPPRKPKKATPTDKMDEVLDVLQDLFILQALQAGINVNDIRKLLKIDMWRVSNISKLLKK